MGGAKFLVGEKMGKVQKTMSDYKAAQISIS